MSQECQACTIKKIQQELELITKQMVKIAKKIAKKIEKDDTRKRKTHKASCVTEKLPHHNEKWHIYTQKGCGYCDLAKQSLRDNKQEFSVTDLEGFNMTDKLAELTKNYKFVPIVFFNNRFIGGFQELQQKLKKIKKQL